MSHVPSSLSPSQLHAIVSTERAMSSLSLASSLFVMGTFLGSNLFQTPINRLIFYATMGNVLANVGTMIGRSALDRNQAETNALCQFQGFFLQWFVGADSLWIFCMAFNVYLTLFRHYSPRDLRKLEWRYFIVCYGIPFVPALVFLCINTKSKGPIYGRATLWCWIRPEWDEFRIGFFYGPIWFVILLTFSILLYAAKEIIVSRRHVKQVTSDRIFSADNLAEPRMPRNWTLQPDIHINEPVPTGHHAAARVNGGVGDDISPSTTLESARHQTTDGPEVHPSLTVGAVADSTSIAPDLTAPPNSPEGDHPATPQSDVEPSPGPHANGPISLTGSDRRDNIYDPTAPRRNLSQDFQPWNRSPPRSMIQQDESGSSQEVGSSLRRRASIERRTAAYMYSKRAILFFLALIITWTPPSINRIYLLAHPEQPGFAIAYLASLTLPLQGFWNCVIYIATSMDAVKALWWMSTSTIRHKIGGISGDERRPSWESALQRARRTKRKMSFAPPSEGLEMGHGSGTTPAGEGLGGGRRASHDRESIWGMKRLRGWWSQMSDAGSAARRSSQDSWARCTGFLVRRTREGAAVGAESAPSAAVISGSHSPSSLATSEVPAEDVTHTGHVSAPALPTQTPPEESGPPTRSPSPSKQSSGSVSRSPVRPWAGSSDIARDGDEDTQNIGGRADSHSRHNGVNVHNT